MMQPPLQLFNPLTTKNNKHLIDPTASPINININVTRMKGMIVYLRSSGLFDKFSLQVPQGMYREQH